MLLICAFIIVNILFSHYLERIKYRVATVAHAVLFIFLLVCIFLTSDIPIIVRISKAIISEESYETLQSSLNLSITIGMSIITPFIVINFTLTFVSFLLGLVIAILFVKRIIELVKVIRTPILFKINRYILQYILKKIYKYDKLFILNRRIRC